MPAHTLRYKKVDAGHMFTALLQHVSVEANTEDSIQDTVPEQCGNDCLGRHRNMLQHGQFMMKAEQHTTPGAASPCDEAREILFAVARLRMVAAMRGHL